MHKDSAPNQKKEVAMSLTTVLAGFLVIGGLFNAVPQIPEKMKSVSGGRPILQVLIGIVSTVMGLALITRVI